LLLTTITVKKMSVHCAGLLAQPVYLINQLVSDPVEALSTSYWPREIIICHHHGRFLRWT